MKKPVRKKPKGSPKSSPKGKADDFAGQRNVVMFFQRS